MPRRKKTPFWVQTNVPWENKILVWGRMAQGANDSQIGAWLDQQVDLHDRSLSLDRSTVRRLRDELKELPQALIADLPEMILWYRAQLRKENQKDMIEEPPSDKTKASLERTLSSFDLDQRRRGKPHLQANIGNTLPERSNRRKKRHMVKAGNSRMTWCGRSLDGPVHLFQTDKIEFCTCWHCNKWYKVAVNRNSFD